MGSTVLPAVIALSGGACVALLLVVGAASRAADHQPGAPASAEPAPLALRLLLPMVVALSARLRRLDLRLARTRVDLLVARAGAPFGLDADDLLALSGIGLLSGTLVGVRLAGALGAIGVVALAAVGCGYPIVWIGGRGAARMTAIDRGLARANDLLVLSLEAGTDLVGAVRQVVQRASASADPLRAELARLLRDLELGSTRRGALEALAERAPSDAVRGLVASMIQAEQRGTPLAQALRVQAGALRTARSQQIEVRASRASVLVMLPLLLIFGATILLVFGGVVVRAMRGDLL